MSKKKEIRPFYSVFHEYEESFEAYRLAVIILQKTVGTVLHLSDKITSVEQAKELIETLRQPYESFLRSSQSD